MEKILYISELDLNQKIGGAETAKYEFSILNKNFDVENRNFPIKKRNKFKKLFDLFFSPIAVFYSRKDVKILKKIIRTSDAKIVYFNNSILGALVKYAKKLNKKCIVRYQNCEYKLALDCKRYFYYKDIKKNEKMSLKYANFSFILNEIDKIDLEKYYKVKLLKYDILPPIIKDTFVPNYSYDTKENYGLFIGAYFKPNLEAIDFIYSNFKNLKSKIKVIGYNLEKYTPICSNENIELIGTVDDISPYILNASYMIFPIYSGSGMKIKTAQSMMYGKEIFGTPMAFDGYILDKNHMHTCSSKDDFINEINKYLSKNINLYNPSVRDVWKNNYSLYAIENKLVSKINEIIKS